ncbi:hypothetical protein [Candidatus Tisiphia endosymbiont of Sialis lutaria]
MTNIIKFRITTRREKMVEQRGIRFILCIVNSGEFGARSDE